MALAVGVFIIALALIASERINRTAIALAGAGVMVVTQTIAQEDAIAAVDFNTLGLLLGMMLIVRMTETTGVYSYLAVRAGQLSGGRPLGLVIALCGSTALLSAFLDNLTTVMLMVPITFVLADALEIDPIPLVIMEVIASNIGGTATLIGDPPNIMIGGATGLSFMQFIANLAPIAAVSLVAVTALQYVWFRGRLQIAPAARERVLELDPNDSITDRAELRRAVPVLIGTILLFFVHKPLGLEPATVALLGATVLILISSQSLDEVLAGVQWATLLFFTGLFVMVGALEETGAIGKIADGVATVTDGNRTAELLGILWISGIASGAVDNIPFTATMIPVVDQLQGDDAHWWALALGACFGGNFTLIAAAANVAAAGMAERAGKPIGFMQFLRVGVPVSLISLVLATIYVLLRYA